MLPLLATPDAASVPLIDSRGVILGYIGWTPNRPGLTLIRKTGPALLVGARCSAPACCGSCCAACAAPRAQLQSSQDHAQFLAFHDR